MLEQDATNPETSNITETPEGEPVQKTESEGDAENKPRPNGLQKRIDKLTREKYELRGELNALRARVAQPQPARQEAEGDGEGEDEKPMTRREAMEMAHNLARQQQAARDQQATQQEWKRQESEAKKRYSDYDEVVPDFVDTWNPPRHVEAAILECEKKVEVTYYLAKHPDEADAIASMSPFRAAAEIGKIEARLESPALKKQSAAPEPIAPVKPKGNADDGMGDELSVKDWLKRRNAQIRKR